MIVEFIGLPGVGKTSIIKNLQKYSDSKDKINFIGKNKCKHGSVLIELLKFYMRLIFFYPSIILNIRQSMWLLTKISLRLCHRSNNVKEEICVLNESGILMPIVSFIVQRDKHSYKINLNKIMSVLPLPDVIVFVEADFDKVVDRYAKRGGVQTKGLGVRDSVIVNTELYERFLLGQNTLSALKDILKRKNCTVIKIKNNDLPDYKMISTTLYDKLVSQL
jgi:deoxyadenosine/deoxycytidine kinase